MNTKLLIALCASVLMMLASDRRDANQSIPMHEKNIEHENEYQVVTIAYPQFPDICPAINQAIENVVQSALEAHTQACKHAPDYLTAPWYLNIGYTVAQANERYLSLVLHGHAYTGGAHSYSWSKCFNYDLKTQKKLTIEDIEPSPCWLEVVSNLCYQNITSQRARCTDNQEDFQYHKLFHEGLLPIAKNFEQFTFTDNEINIHFQEYQITCYAAGVPEVVLDRTELRHYFALGKGPFVPPTHSQ